MGFFSKKTLKKTLKKIAPIALPVAFAALGPLALGGAGAFGAAAGSSGLLGTGLTGALSSGIGGALGGGLGGFAGGKGLTGALQGAAIGGAGGYLSNGGFSQLSNALGGSTSLSTPGSTLGSFSDSAARQAASTAARPSGLAGYLPAGSTNAGGGSAGGFFDFGNGVTDAGLEVGKVYNTSPTGTFSLADAVGRPALESGGIDSLASALPQSAAPTFAADPLGYIGNQISDGADSVFSGNNLLRGGLKTGLSSYLQDDNTGGYNAVQAANEVAAANLNPYTAPGAQASGALASLYGLNGPDAATAAMRGFQTSPGYTFARDEGIRALDASAASKGLLLSGNQQQAVQRYGTGLAEQYYQQYLQDLQRQAAVGVNAQVAANSNTVNSADAFAQLKRDRGRNNNQMFADLLSYL